MKQLGTLQKVELRSIWPSEATDFTPWLAEEGNIATLGDAIGLELEVEEVEKNVGPYRADILCKEEGTEHWILIENQIEKTNHTHLGQILTYAAGLHAVTIVWIAERFTEEHRAALDWLNEVTTDEINFFGLEIELWKIGNSEPAPKFNVVCRPNEWTKGGARTKQMASADLSETRQLQLQYWSEFREYLQSVNTPLKTQKAAPCHWMNFSIGTSIAHCSALVDTVKPHIGVRLQFNNCPGRIALFEHLEKDKEEIESKLGFKVLWEKKPEKNSSYLTVHNKNYDPKHKESWQKQFEWLRHTLEAFRKHLPERIKDFANSGMMDIDHELENP